MKIVFLDKSTVGDLENINRLRELGELEIYEVTFPDQTIERIKDAQVVITNKVVIDKNVMDKATDLKLICIAATGMNNVDLEYAAKKGIMVKNVEDYSTYSVVQATFAMLLYLINHMRYYDEYVKSGKHIKSPIFTHLEKDIFELRDKVFGIIGLGNIGRSVAVLAEAFSCKVIYYSTSGKNFNPDYTRVSLDQLLNQADIVSIHAPLNEQTRNLITLKEMKKMKRTSILINAGRGGIVNEKDLARAIDDGIIGSAGVDVLTKEPVQRDNPLLRVRQKEKLLITPHIAWASVESRGRLMDKVYDNIREFFKAK